VGGLVSRILGMARDMATASLLGTANGVFDCFVFAFQVPQFVRRVFGDGAQSASYLPLFSQLLETNPREASRLASANLWLWLGLSLILTAVGEVCCLAGWWFSASGSLQLLAFQLAAILLPYLIFLCLTAQMVSTLHALGRFGVAVACTIWVNVAWLITAAWFAPRLATDPVHQSYILALAILLAAGAQALLVAIPLIQSGFRWRRVPLRGNAEIRKILRQFLPAMFGMGSAQANTTIDTLIAWVLTTSRVGGTQLSRGAVASMYLGERLFMFPVGLVGQAVGTAIFPLLSRHAARGDLNRVRQDLIHGLRIVATWGIPASLGLVAMSQPIAILLYRGGEFTLEDAERTGRVIAGYGWGACSFSALSVLVRGCYAMNEFRLPTIWGVTAICVNVVLNILFVGVWREAGLAVATSIAATIQATGLLFAFSSRHGPLPWANLMPVLGKVIVGSILAVGAGWWLSQLAPPVIDRRAAFTQVSIAVISSLVLYLVILRGFGIALWRDTTNEE
jgi:putative peptidoglycan lipid II flippase